jgi:hypothetical protein
MIMGATAPIPLSVIVAVRSTILRQTVTRARARPEMLRHMLISQPRAARQRTADPGISWVAIEAKTEVSLR